jgi:hypothetical protein
MSDGNDPQVQTAQQSAGTVESAPTTVEAPVVEQQSSEQLSVPAESASAQQGALVSPVEETKTPEKTGSEPAVDSQVVEELKKVRRRAQQAEQELRQKAEEAANLRGQLEERNKQAVSATAQPKTVDGTKPPQVNDYENYDDFLEAKITYNMQVKENARKQEEVKVQRDKEQKSIDSAFYARVAKVQAEKLPDYDEVIRSTPFNVNTGVLQAIKESEIGPEVAYHLAKNPSIIEKIGQMSFASAVREIGKIEAQLSTNNEPVKKQTKQVSQAPEPIKTVNASAAPVTVDPDKQSIDDWMSRRISETTVKVGNRVKLKRI